eukprot:GGOE01058413.1.p1 GENE.GGOE01058413.1~~GGOE01058413.1.p1  ORF type:complete len:837 (-),score=123.00 GGOE01058413.1:561-2897(-)
MSALELEEEVRGEICKWEQYGMLQPPQNQSQPRIRDHTFDTGPSSTVAAGSHAMGGEHTVPQFEPFNPNMAVDRDLAQMLAFPQIQRIEKEPTRIVNLRRRLQRILATREKLERPDQPLPDNRQLAALVAEAEIVWEIDKWERFRIIYPNKPEMQYIPPGSLGIVGDHDDLRDPQPHHSGSGSGSAGTEDKSTDENSGEGGSTCGQMYYVPPPAMPLGHPMADVVKVSQPRGLAMDAAMGKGPASSKVSTTKAVIKGQEALNPTVQNMGILPLDVPQLKGFPQNPSPAVDPSAHCTFFTPPALPYAPLIPTPIVPAQPVGEKPFLPPTPGIEGVEATPCAKDIPKEPTRIVNLRRRLHRIQNTKAKLAQAWGPQPDNRQMAALEAEPAILWEIQQWEQYGVLATKSPHDTGSEAHGSGESMRDSSTLTEPYKDQHEGDSSGMDHWVHAVEEAQSKERKRRQQIARKERAAARQRTKAAAHEDADTSSDTSEGDDGGALLAAEMSDMAGRRRELFKVLTSKSEDSVLTRIRRRGGSLLDNKYYKTAEADLLHIPNRPRVDGVPELPEPTWLPPTPELKVVPGQTPKPTHFLENSWTIWFDESEEDDQAVSLDNYREAFTELGSFNTIQGFWTYWNNLRVDNLRENCNLRLFKSDIKPTWEDPYNAEGGCWVAKDIPKCKRSKLWGDIVMAMVGELTEDNSHESICGVVLSTRHEGDRIQLWIDGGYLYRTRPDLYHSGEDYRDTRATMQKLAEICDFDDDVHFIYRCHALCYQAATQQN